MTEELFHIETRQKADALFSVPSQDAVIPGPGVPTPPRPTLLGVGQTFTSPVREVDGYSSIALIVLSDQPFQVRVQESNTPTGPVGQTSVTSSTLDGISFLQKVVLRITPSGSFMKILVDNLGAQQRTFLLTGLGIPVAGTGPGGSSGGAPSTSSFILFSADASLPNARVITAGANITIVDGGPGGALTISSAGGGGSLEQARAVGDTFTGGDVFWDNSRAAVFGKASGEANQDYLRVYSDKVNSLQVVDSTKDGAGVIRPISVQMGGTEVWRTLPGGEICVGRTTVVGTDGMLNIERNVNGQVAIYVQNDTNGTNAGAAISVGASDGAGSQNTVSLFSFSPAFTSVPSLAGQIGITGGGILTADFYLNMRTGVNVKFGTANIERMRLLGTGEFIYGATTLTGTEVFKIVGDTLIEGKLTVTGLIDPTAVLLSDPAAGTELYFDSADGGTAPVSAAGHARIRYADPTGWEESVNGGAYTPLGGGGAALQLVERKVLVADATDVTFSGLDGDVDNVYILHILAENEAAGALISLEFNGDTGAANYFYQNFNVILNSPGYGPGAPTGPAYIAAGGTGQDLTVETKIFAKSGRQRAYMSRQTTTQIDLRDLRGHWTNTADNITSMKLKGSVANTFKSGAQLTLYRMPNG